MECGEERRNVSIGICARSFSCLENVARSCRKLRLSVHYDIEAVHRKVHGATAAEGYIGDRVRIEIAAGQSAVAAIELTAP